MLLLVTVICLGSAVLLLPERGGADAEPSRVVPFAPSQITEISVELPGGTRQRLVRTAADRWEIELPGAETAAPVRWPASIDRVHGFLRILDRLRAMPAENSPSDAPTRWARIADADGKSVSIGLPAASLGGRSLIHVSEGPDGPGRPLLTSDELTRLLAGQALLNWLDTRAFAGLSGRVMDVAVASGGQAMRFTRTASGWRIVEPFETSAEDDLVEELVRGLQALPFTSPSPGGVGHEAPADPTVVTLTSEVRRPADEGRVEAETVTHALRTLAPPDAGGRVQAALESRSASDGEPTSGPLSVEVAGDRLMSLVRQPRFYLARRALHAAPGDLQGFVIAYPSGRQVRWTREAGGGWGSDAGPTRPADGAMLDALATLLTQTPAASAAWLGDSARPQQILATIDCLGLGGASLSWVQLGVGRPPEAGEDTKVHAVVTGGGVARYYEPEPTRPLVQWIHESDQTDR